MKKERELLKQARDWIDGNGRYDKAKQLVKDIDEALAQPEQEPTNLERHERNVQQLFGTPQPKEPEQEPVAWAVRTLGGRKWHSIHASKAASDRWLEYRIKEQAQGEKYEQLPFYTTPSQRNEDAIEIAGLTSAVGHLSAIVDEQRAILVEVERVCGVDGHGGLLEDGESELIDRVRAHLAAIAPPQRKPLTDEQRRAIIQMVATVGQAIDMVEAAHGIKE